MATFDATTTATTFALMEAEAKTVYVVPRTPAFDGICSGDRIEFEPLGSVTVGAVRRYESIDALLAAEGLANVVPDATDVAAASEALRAEPVWNRKGETAGVLALRVRSTKRKA